jgi:hypothetical protein
MKCLFGLLIYLFSASFIYAQKIQLGVSTGPAFLYMVEDATTDVNYYEGIGFQTDLVVLNKDEIENFGLSLFSNSIDAYREINNSEFFSGRITNTGFFLNKYFVKNFADNLSGNLQVGIGQSVESNYNGNMKFFFNISSAVGFKYMVSNRLYLTSTVMAVAQDIPNIIRFSLYRNGVEAGEDLHLLTQFGVAYNWSK